MQIFLNILFLIIGMVLLIYGADFFVKGASGAAKRLKVPSLFIGLTIVAIGTSLPELSVSIAAAINKSVDLSVGNIVGSNMFNMLFILGIVALIKPISTKNISKKLDFTFFLGLTFILLLFSCDKYLNGTSENIISRTESIILLALVIIYTFLLILDAKKKKEAENVYKEFNGLENKESEDKPKEEKILKVWQIILFLVLGLAAVVFGGECVSTTAKFLAIKMGMSETLVGLTIVAIGTSLPELATSVVAAKKGEVDLAVGNVIGSNIFNIGLILGTVGTITQLPVTLNLIIDMAILLAFSIMFVVFCISKQKISRIEGGILFASYLLYLTFIILRNYVFVI